MGDFSTVYPSFGKRCSLLNVLEVSLCYGTKDKEKKKWIVQLSFSVRLSTGYRTVNFKLLSCELEFRGKKKKTNAFLGPFRIQNRSITAHQRAHRVISFIEIFKHFENHARDSPRWWPGSKRWRVLILRAPGLRRRSLYSNNARAPRRDGSLHTPVSCRLYKFGLLIFARRPRTDAYASAVINKRLSTQLIGGADTPDTRALASMVV